MTTKQDVEQIARIVTEVLQAQESRRRGVANIGSNVPPRLGQPPYVDYERVSLGRVSPRSHIEMLMDALDARRAYNHQVRFMVKSTLDQAINIQIKASDEATPDRHNLFFIGAPLLLLRESNALIYIGPDSWMPFLFISISPATVSTRGDVSAVGLLQKWYVPTRD